MDSVYHNLELTKTLALEYAKDHNCNYNVIIMNPNSKGEFDISAGSTYEIVQDSYFEKERPNAKLIFKTDVEKQDTDVPSFSPGETVIWDSSSGLKLKL